MLSLVDNHTYRRLAYRVLDHSPKAAVITGFLKDFKKQLDARDLKVAGITTDGSPLYPKPPALVFNGVPHQICQFHIVKELTKSILHALAKVRKERKAKLQRITRGLPPLRVLREIMDEVYGLFDRRCRSETALVKPARLRRRVKRFKDVGKTLTKLYSPNLEKALTFLDDKRAWPSLLAPQWRTSV